MWHVWDTLNNIFKYRWQYTWDVVTQSMVILSHCVESFQIRSFLLVRIFPYFNWIRRFTQQIFVFSPNTEKNRPEKTPYLGTFQAVSLVFVWTCIRKNHYVLHVIKISPSAEVRCIEDVTIQLMVISSLSSVWYVPGSTISCYTFWLIHSDIFVLLYTRKCY